MIRKKTSPAEKVFQKAKNLIAKGDARRGFSYILEALRSDPGRSETLDTAARTAEMLGDKAGGELFRSMAANPEDSSLLYRAGFHFIEMGRPDVARAFLQACLDKNPGNADVGYELGYSLFLNREYAKAFASLTAAVDKLSPERAAAAQLLRIECLLYDHKSTEAESLINRFKKEQGGREAETAGREAETAGRDHNDSLEALELMAKRLRRLEDIEIDSARTWHFIQHGGVLLAESRKEKSAGRFDSLTMNAAAVGAILRLLKSFLKGMKIEPSAVCHLEGEGYPLALAAGSLLERPVRRFSKRLGTGELLIVHDGEALRGLEAETAGRNSVESLFCFRLDPGRPCPVLPDIVGLMARSFRFPWQERVEIIEKPGEKPSARNIPADERDPESIAAEIAELGAMLPEDKKIASLLEFYRKERSLLVLSNRKRFPLRRSFTPFSPV